MLGVLWGGTHREEGVEPLTYGSRTNIRLWLLALS